MADTGSAFPAGQILIFGLAILVLGAAVYSLRRNVTWDDS